MKAKAIKKLTLKRYEPINGQTSMAIANIVNNDKTKESNLLKE